MVPTMAKFTIIKLIGKKVGFCFLQARLQKMWNPKCGMLITDMDNDYYLVNFALEPYYTFALHEGPWMIPDHYLVVQRWRPDFDPFEDNFNRLAVWVDTNTLKRQEEELVVERGKFAHICVEVDLSKNLISTFTLRKRVRGIEYERIHLICFHCGTYGHKVEDCPITKTKDEAYRPWMHVQRPNRRYSNRSESNTDKKNGGKLAAKPTVPKTENRSKAPAKKAVKHVVTIKEKAKITKQWRKKSSEEHTVAVAAGSRFSVIADITEEVMEDTSNKDESMEALKGIDHKRISEKIKEAKSKSTLETRQKRMSAINKARLGVKIKATKSSIEEGKKLSQRVETLKKEPNHRKAQSDKPNNQKIEDIPTVTKPVIQTQMELNGLGSNKSGSISRLPSNMSMGPFENKQVMDQQKDSIDEMKATLHAMKILEKQASNSAGEDWLTALEATRIYTNAL
ncbi:uncharacterized protein G2W53_015345 [Senna tora]|uniref:CCHC-type domain-containing protein n=1 Tax=Senna tora TaxID=362788 RepID=A0A835C9Q3_9FABA|nr:uncharacterized protein G2W53_015345 [Senna tora]